MIDRVEISIINEEQPLWLAFLNGQLDMLEVPGAFAQQAMPGGKLAPYLARRGVRGSRELVPRIRLLWFNMNDPVVGGYTPEKSPCVGRSRSHEHLARERRSVGQPVARPTRVRPFQTGFDPLFAAKWRIQPGTRQRAARHLRLRRS